MMTIETNEATINRANTSNETGIDIAYFLSGKYDFNDIVSSIDGCVCVYVCACVCVSV